jgi:hypothetical protein
MSAKTLIIDTCDINELINLPNTIEYLFINYISIDFTSYIKCNLPTTLKYLYINTYFLKGLTYKEDTKSKLKLFLCNKMKGDDNFENYMLRYRDEMILLIERALPHGCKLELNPYFPKMYLKTTPHDNMLIPMYLYDEMNETLTDYKNINDNIFTNYIKINKISELNKEN